MDWIDDSIAIGNWVDARCVRNLKREKIDVIIDSRTLFSRPGTVRNMPDMNLVIRAAQMMVDLSRLNAKILVFCRHGKDRSPFLAMIYLSRKNGITCEQAYQLIKSKRPRTIFHPEWVEKLGALKSK
jgi:hypothetical protein